MTYNKRLAERMREALVEVKKTIEKNMLGEGLFYGK